MPKLSDILLDKTKYPDDLKISLHGEDTTVGDLRKDAIPSGEFTKVTQKHSAEKQNLERQIKDTNSQLARAIAERTGSRPNTDREGNILDADLKELEGDPIFGGMVNRVKKLERSLTEAVTRIGQHELVFTANQHLAVIDRLKGRDKNLNTDALLDFAKNRGIGNLDDAYNLMTKDDAVKSARDEGRKEGIDEGKRQAQVPVIPFGHRSRSREASAPKDLDSAVDAAMSDPDVLNAYHGVSG
ncbi:MAG: hypothetical protein D4R44_04020 [Actinobacteria bacterium]|nr:MAG: hypothetical protein D4R44_04020 [Actinomycetota bacterium]